MLKVNKPETQLIETFFGKMDQIEQYLKTLQLHIDKNNDSLVRVAHYLETTKKDNVSDKLNKLAHRPLYTNLPTGEKDSTAPQDDEDESWRKFAGTPVCSPERSDPVGLTLCHVSLLERSETTTQALAALDSLIEHLSDRATAMEAYNDEFASKLRAVGRGRATGGAPGRDATRTRGEDLEETVGELSRENETLWKEFLQTVQSSALGGSGRLTPRAESLLRRLVAGEDGQPGGPPPHRDEFVAQPDTACLLRFLLRNQWARQDSAGHVLPTSLEEPLASLADL